MESEYHQFLTAKYNDKNSLDKYQYFTDMITNAVQMFTPMRRTVDPKKHRNPVDWWDADCDRAKRLRQAAYRRWDFTRSEDDRDKYRAAKKEARRLFKKKEKGPRFVNLLPPLTSDETSSTHGTKPRY